MKWKIVCLFVLLVLVAGCANNGVASGEEIEKVRCNSFKGNDVGE